MALIKNPLSQEELSQDRQQPGVHTMSLQLLQEDRENITLPILGLLSLKDAIKGAGLFAMREINPNNVESLACSDPQTWPPILVTKTDRGYIYYDGQHRIEAAKICKLETIQATCKTFQTVNDLIEATFRANLKHGLQASQETKSDYCYWLSVTFPNLSQQQIANRVGVTQSTVSRAILQRKKQLEEVKQQAAQEEEETDGELNVWKEGLVKRARNLVKSVSKFADTVKEADHYQQLVQELQVELLQEPEDRTVLLFTGQLLVDAAQRSKTMRKVKA